MSRARKELAFIEGQLDGMSMKHSDFWSLDHDRKRLQIEVLEEDYESLQAQLKRERELTDELISSAQTLASHYEIHVGGASLIAKEVDQDIAAIHSEREGSK